MNNSFKIISPNSDEEFKRYYHFRWKLLRKPYAKEPGTEIDQFEDISYHQMILNHDEKILAVGRIHFLSKNKDAAQIRYMAVDNQYSNKGFGTKMLISLEIYAKKNKIKKIVLNSREHAIGFYLKNGYKKIKKTHILYNQIQHWLMEKEIC